MASAPHSKEGSGDKKAAVELFRGIEYVGQLFKFFISLSKDGKHHLLTGFFLLLAYPVIAFVIVLLILRISTESMQNYARQFILASFGVDEKVQSEIFENNGFIDFSRTLIFSTASPVPVRHYQDVRTGQEVRMTCTAVTQQIPNSSADCATFSWDQQLSSLGTIFISHDDVDARETRELREEFNRRRVLKRLRGEFWQKVRDLYDTGPIPYESTLIWSFQPSLQLKELAAKLCFEVDIALTITVFEPNV